MPRAKKPAPGSINPSIPAAPGGMAYGQRKSLEDSVAAVPIAPTSSPAPVAETYAAAQQYRPPNIGFGRPSDRPDEPVTAGIPTGVQPAVAPGPDPDVLAMARYLPTLERLASMPNASISTRAFVRRLRSMLPPDFEFDQ